VRAKPVLDPKSPAGASAAASASWPWSPRRTAIPMSSPNHSLDVHRTNANRPLSIDVGIHRCLGGHALSHAQGEKALDVILSRLDDLQLSTGATFENQYNLCGFATLLSRGSTRGHGLTP